MGKFNNTLRLLLIGCLLSNLCYAQDSIWVQSNKNGLVQYNTQFTSSNTHLFVLYGNGEFGTQLQPQHRFPEDSTGYVTEAYFARGYHPNLPTRMVVNTGAIGTGSTHVNPQASMQGEVDILTSWAVTPTYSTFFILAFRNTIDTQAIKGCIELLYHSNDLSVDHPSIKEYNNWVNNRSNSSGSFGVYNTKIKWDFDSLDYQEVRYVYVPATALKNVGKKLKLSAELKIDCSDKNPNNSSSNADFLIRTYPHDPNFKIVDRECLPNDRQSHQLNYTISFYNDGNGFAKDVHVEDQLSYLLNTHTFQLLDFEVEPHVQFNNNTLTFDWFNINLPGTNQSSPKTYSYDEATTYVSFSICTVPELRLGECISNEAIITFDQQPYFITDPPAITCVMAECAIPPVHCPNWRSGITPPNSQLAKLDQSAALQVSPNPFDQQIEVQWAAPVQSDYRITLMNFSGQLIRTLDQGLTADDHYQEKFDLSGLPPGIYWLVAQTTDQQAVQKIVKW